MTQMLSAGEIEAIVRKAVRDELASSGLRVDTPDHQEEALEDFRFLRKFRRAFDGAASKIGGAVILAIVSGFIWLIWLGFQAITSR